MRGNKQKKKKNTNRWIVTFGLDLVDHCSRISLGESALSRICEKTHHLIVREKVTCDHDESKATIVFNVLTLFKRIDQMVHHRVASKSRVFLVKIGLGRNG